MELNNTGGIVMTDKAKKRKCSSDEIIISFSFILKKYNNLLILKYNIPLSTLIRVPVHPG